MQRSWRRILGGATFLLIVLSVLVWGHVYLARRLVIDLELAAPLEAALVGGIVLLASTLVLQPIGERTLRPPFSRLIAWPASLWMGFAFLLLVGLGVSELLVWALSAPAVAGVEGDLAASGAARGRALAVAGVAGFAGLFGLWTALQPPRVKRIELELPRWPRGLDGFRLVQISDIHVGPILGRPFAEDLVARVNALAPDLIAVTGDLVDGSVAKLADEVSPFARLRAPHGVYFVTGNHDYFSGADEWAGLVASMGIRVLRNERVQIGSGADAFDLAGVEDHHAHWVTGGSGEDLPRALADRDPSRCVVLLAHDPGSFREAAELGVDLQLSGHTHGGQIWPFVYLVRIFVRHVAGLYRAGASQLYVSRGTGFWGPPMRLFAPAEITEIALRSPRR